MGRKVRKCRICEKSPVWRGGDVKNPGPFCKRCYHKHISPGRQRGRREKSQPVPPDEFGEYTETREVLDFLGIDNLREHLALESFRYAMGESYLWERPYYGLIREEEIAVREMDSAEDDDIPF